MFCATFIFQTRSSLPYVFLKIISKIYLYSFFFISALYRYFTKQRTIKIIAATRLTFQPIENPGGVYFKETVCSPEGTFTPRKASPIRHVFTSLPSTFTFHQNHMELTKIMSDYLKHPLCLPENYLSNPSP